MVMCIVSLKPDSILLVKSRRGGNGTEFVPKIRDFGLNKKRKSDRYLRGTALYTAPESAVDHVQEAPSDIWALGCIVFGKLTGTPVWDLKPEATTEELLRKIGDELPEIPPQISKDGRDFLKGWKPVFRSIDC